MLAIYAFMASFGLLGGLVIMGFPVPMFATSFVIIAIQTMVHHVGIVLVGVYLIVRGKIKPSKNTFLGAFIVFSIAVSVALMLNTAVYFAWDYMPGNMSWFNLFYISPFETTIMPIFDLMQQVSWFLFFPAYIILTSLFAFLMTSAVHALSKIKDIKKNPGQTLDNITKGDVPPQGAEV